MVCYHFPSPWLLLREGAPGRLVHLLTASNIKKKNDTSAPLHDVTVDDIDKIIETTAAGHTGGPSTGSGTGGGGGSGGGGTLGAAALRIFALLQARGAWSNL